MPTTPNPTFLECPMHLGTRLKALREPAKPCTACGGDDPGKQTGWGPCVTCGATFNLDGTDRPRAPKPVGMPGAPRAPKPLIGPNLAAAIAKNAPHPGA